LADEPNASDDAPKDFAPMLRARAIARLRTANNYWIATTRPDGRPHSAPVWGVWLDDGLWFGTMGQKVTNLAANPYAVVHLDSADDVIMVQGPVEVVRDRALLQRAADAFRAKYVDGETGEPFDVFPVLGEEPALYRVTPETGWAWLEGAYASHNTRWTFGAPDA